MKTLDRHRLSRSEFDALLRRPGIDLSNLISNVTSILRNVETNGDAGIRELTLSLDKLDLSQFEVSDEEFEVASRRVGPGIQEAIYQATSSLRAFHLPQLPEPVNVETMPGVQCRLEWRPIERVGLYVPGGSAPLISTVLMLGIPAILAKCPKTVLCTPPRSDGTVSSEILFAAKSLGLTTVFKIGGAQAIAAMAVGTESVPRVAKLFGPGNRYVAAMKSLVSRPPYNVAIDMHAGPSELLIIADEAANERWVAADLLSQAEHGTDSPVILVTPSASLAEKVAKELTLQSAGLPRLSIITQALANSSILVVDSIDEAIEFSNSYAPEHLILAMNDAESISPRITNAGSVFLGPMTSVVFGDYASGTNHTLPTGGTAVSFGGLTVRDFLKPVFFQTAELKGLQSLSSTVKILARAEGLEAHARAIEVREGTR
jgi:histidinol dehydrogenase